ncbi:hypothetical protein [Tellurirhabdus bombi]|uniref:hypothetical protein n=1 Tax=Tellurirhabdus bombi TaxID=2907205 RepID=UPI001F41BCC9|nr:hypothetical protein [Tellurirhabdus bombi]
MQSTTTRFALLLALLLSFNACKKAQNDTEKTAQTDSAQVEAATVASAEVEVSDDLRKLIGSSEGLFRGVSLGDALADVKAKEKLEQFEKSDSHVGYSFEYPNLESADILYFHNKTGQINKIDVDLYLNDKKSLEKFNRELTDYFTQRFGKVTQQGKEMTWQAANTHLVMKDVTKGTNYGLKLTFTPAETPTTAKR